jgi:hypothetical protein
LLTRVLVAVSTSLGVSLTKLKGAFKVFEIVDSNEFIMAVAATSGIGIGI